MADDLAEVLARLRRHVQRVRDDGYTVSSRIGLEDLTAILDAAEAGMRARDAALEEAVQAAERTADGFSSAADYAVGYANGCNDCAAAIRALKEKPNG